MNRTAIKAKMSEVLGVGEHRLADDAVLTDLVTDSFVLIDMVIELQDEFDIILVQQDLKDVKTVGQLCSLVYNRAHEAAAGAA
jgi:acyl carrier protein